jgi:hypothetical protein
MTDTPVQTLATVFGAVFVIVGIAGFVPGITTSYGDLQFAGPDSRAMLLGIFQVSILHNVVHLVFGIVGLALARTWDGARTFLVGGGVIYAVLWVYGVLVGQDSSANFVPVNRADNWLHLILAVTMIAGGILLTRGERSRAAPTT